ncbi:HpcH/HpaI aldolase family protein [Phytohabitans suffuscus]|uniref:Aldolase n=1 Tax=Phytohabitans suffuscus TaxID=624315 RepID=A0A6F8YZB2_9ACTN|nr:aldolase/citrate lyase family protein [Phytohabitans suffuscus]BCB91333.1 aldolase [Phytohabitans suffuscus]
MRVNHVKQELLAGKVRVGTWLHTLGSPELPQILSTAGFDFINVDMEHSSFSLKTVSDLCYAALQAGIVPVVRPPDRQHHLMSRPLDQGALGIYAPHVDTVEDARDVLDAVKFPPVGHRGSQPPSIVTSFRSFDAGRYMPEANAQTMVVVQLESRLALENADAILALPGVDGAVVGRGDLAADLGLGGQRGHPELDRAVEHMIAACARHGKVPGLMVLSVEDGRRWVERGVRMVTYASEMLMLRDAGTAAVAALRP